MIELQFRYKMVDLVELLSFRDLPDKKNMSKVLCVRKVLKLVFLTSRAVLMAYFSPTFFFLFVYFSFVLSAPLVPYFSFTPFFSFVSQIFSQ